MSTAIVPSTATSSIVTATGSGAMPSNLPWVERVKALPPKKQWGFATALAGIIAIVVVLLVWQTRSDYKVLFSNLDDKSAGAVVAQLGQMGIPYKYTEGGGAIMVPSEHVHDTRLKLATSGLPQSSVVGFELMDNVKFGQTQTQERVNIQRALEGELTRTISALQAVDSARVHIALPNQNGFFRQQQKPSASVVVNLKAGRTLDASQIAGIVHLVSASVPELSTKAVSVLDQTGALLSDNPEDETQGSNDRQLKYARQMESQLLQRINEIIEPLVGKSNYRATVTADIDFNQTEQTSEEYRPNQAPNSAAVRSSVNLVDSSGAGNETPAGIPGAATNQPPVAANAPITGQPESLQGAGSGTGAAGAGRKENTTNFEVDKTVRVTRNASGLLRKVNAAVVLNHVTNTDAKGKTTTEALPEQEIARITSLVQEAIGFDSKRGDSVKVMSAPFKIEAEPNAEALPFWKQAWLLESLQAAWIPLVLGGIAMALFFGVIRPIVKSTVQARQDTAAALANAATNTPGQIISTVVDEVTGETHTITTPNPVNLGSVNLLSGPSQSAAEKLQAIRALAKENPSAVATIVRDWVNQPA